MLRPCRPSKSVHVGPDKINQLARGKRSPVVAVATNPIPISSFIINLTRLFVCLYWLSSKRVWDFFALPKIG